MGQKLSISFHCRMISDLFSDFRRNIPRLFIVSLKISHGRSIHKRIVTDKHFFQIIVLIITDITDIGCSQHKRPYKKRQSRCGKGSLSRLQRTEGHAKSRNFLLRLPFSYTPLPVQEIKDLPWHPPLYVPVCKKAARPRCQYTEHDRHDQRIHRQYLKLQPDSCHHIHHFRRNMIKDKETNGNSPRNRHSTKDKHITAYIDPGLAGRHTKSLHNGKKSCSFTAGYKHDVADQKEAADHHENSHSQILGCLIVRLFHLGGIIGQVRGVGNLSKSQVFQNLLCLFLKILRLI